MDRKLAFALLNFIAIVALLLFLLATCLGRSAMLVSPTDIARDDEPLYVAPVNATHDREGWLRSVEGYAWNLARIHTTRWPEHHKVERPANGRQQ